MAKKRKSKKKTREDIKRGLHPDTKASILAITFLGLAIVLILSGFHLAGPVGEVIFNNLNTLLGWGYGLIPVALILASINALVKSKNFLATPTIIGALFFIISGLGIMDMISEGAGGLAGNVFGILETPFGKIASIIISLTILIASTIAILNIPIRLNFKQEKKK